MLEIENLYIQFDKRALVDRISFHVRRAEIFSLVGESGSGKSLACLSVLSLLPAKLSCEGKILFTDADGNTEDITGMDSETRSRYALKKIAYIFQEPLSALNPVQTCGKQLLENLKICGVPSGSAGRQRAIELLDSVELHDPEKILNAYPFQLSGGQRQRVMIAMALAGDPDLIIADEPTTALDVIIQDEILNLLRKICLEKQKSILLVSHDLDSVKQFSDRVAVMYQGKIVETGAADQVINHPQHPYTKALLNCKPAAAKKGYYLETLSNQLDDAGKLPPAFKPETASDAKIAELRNVRKEYLSEGKSFPALKDVSFFIRKGSSVGLIGESGSGKSTISRLLVQLESLQKGKIVFDFKNKKPLSSNVQMIFQDPFAALNPALSVSDMLCEVIKKQDPAAVRSARLKTAGELLLKVGLQTEDMKKYPSQFSGGQRQRLCIARALAAKPLLLICDESTSALDLSVQAQILNLLKELQISEQLSILLVTHSMSVAAWFCNHLIVLKNGEVVEQGPTETLLRLAANDYTRSLLAHA